MTQTQTQTLYIDASTLEGRFMRCPREYELHSLMKREGCGPFVGRDFGKAVHCVLDEHYATGQCANVAKHYGDTCADIPMDDYRTVGFLADVYDQYRETYAAEPFTIVEGFDTNGAAVKVIERSFAEPLGSVETASGTTINIVWVGKLDLLTRWPDGALWVVDHKTSSIAGETYWSQFQNSTAQRGYCWAVNRIFKTLPAGYMINALFCRKPAASGRGKGTEFGRQCYPIDTIALDEFVKNTLHSVAEIANCVEAQYFPMHTVSCVRKYGACEFLPVCRLDPSMREAQLRSGMYRDVTWTPLNDEIPI